MRDGRATAVQATLNRIILSYYLTYCDIYCLVNAIINSTVINSVPCLKFDYELVISS